MIHVWTMSYRTGTDPLTQIASEWTQRVLGSLTDTTDAVGAVGRDPATGEPLFPCDSAGNAATAWTTNVVTNGYQRVRRHKNSDRQSVDGFLCESYLDGDESDPGLVSDVNNHVNHVTITAYDVATGNGIGLHGRPDEAINVAIWNQMKSTMDKIGIEKTGDDGYDAYWAANSAEPATTFLAWLEAYFDET